MVGSAGLRMSMTDVSYFTLQADFSKQGVYAETIAGALYTWKLNNRNNRLTGSMQVHISDGKMP